MNIGLMGGTFDPIHLGHLIAAERAREEARLDEVRFMPAFTPPHKSGAPTATAGQRLDMVRLAIEGHSAFKPETIELEREGTSYTIDTMRALTKREPDAAFWFIIGGDMVQYLPKWARIDELAALVRFIGLERPGFPIRLDGLPAAIAERVVPVPMPQLDISSTDIRARLASGRSIRYLVPEAVITYMEEYRIYGESNS